MEKKTIHRIIGVLVVVGLAVIVMPLLLNGNKDNSNTNTQTVSQKAPPFPENVPTSGDGSSAPQDANANNNVANPIPDSSLSQNNSVNPSTDSSLNQSNSTNPSPDSSLTQNNSTLNNNQVAPTQPTAPDQLAANPAQPNTLPPGGPSPQAIAPQGGTTQPQQNPGTQQPIPPSMQPGMQPIPSDQPGQPSAPVMPSPPAPQGQSVPTPSQPGVVPPQMQTTVPGQQPGIQPNTAPIPGQQPGMQPNNAPAQEPGMQTPSSTASPSTISDSVKINSDGTAESVAPAPAVSKVATKKSSHHKKPHASLAQLKQTSWVVQMGSFHNKANAKRLANTLRAKGFKAFTRQIKASTRVYVGPEFKQASAASLANKIEQTINMHGIVVTYHPLEL